MKENDAGNSVLPNNPDFKSDSGQYAMVKSIPPGSSRASYQFVAAVSVDPKKDPLPGLTFFKTKAISFPGSYIDELLWYIQFYNFSTVLLQVGINFNRLVFVKLTQELMVAPLRMTNKRLFYSLELKEINIKLINKY